MSSWMRTDFNFGMPCKRLRVGNCQLACFLNLHRILVDHGGSEPKLLAAQIEALIEHERPELKGVAVVAVCQQWGGLGLEVTVMHPSFPRLVEGETPPVEAIKACPVCRKPFSCEPFAKLFSMQTDGGGVLTVCSKECSERHGTLPDVKAAVEQVENLWPKVRLTEKQRRALAGGTFNATTLPKSEWIGKWPGDDSNSQTVVRKSFHEMSAEELRAECEAEEAGLPQQGDTWPNQQEASEEMNGLPLPVVHQGLEVKVKHLDNAKQATAFEQAWDEKRDYVSANATQTALQTDVLKQREEFQRVGCFGPYVLRMGAEWERRLEEGYQLLKASPVQTLRERLLSIEGVNGIELVRGVSAPTLVSCDSQAMKNGQAMRLTDEEEEEGQLEADSLKFDAAVREARAAR